MIPFTLENIKKIRYLMWPDYDHTIDEYKPTSFEDWNSYRAMLWDWETKNFEKAMKELEFQLKVEELLK